MSNDKFDFMTMMPDYNTLKVTVATKELRNYLRNTFEEFDGLSIKEKYKSKYNNFVAYDHEPFCIEGFNIEFTITSNQFDKLKFIEFIITDRLQRLINLEKQFKLNIDLRTSDGQLIKKLQEV